MNFDLEHSEEDRVDLPKKRKRAQELRKVLGYDEG